MAIVLTGMCLLPTEEALWPRQHRSRRRTTIVAATSLLICVKPGQAESPTFRRSKQRGILVPAAFDLLYNMNMGGSNAEVDRCCRLRLDGCDIGARHDTRAARSARRLGDASCRRMRRGQNKNQRRVCRTDDRTPCSPRRPPMREMEWWCLRRVYVNREVVRRRYRHHTAAR